MRTYDDETRTSYRHMFYEKYYNIENGTEVVCESFITTKNGLSLSIDDVTSNTYLEYKEERDFLSKNNRDYCELLYQSLHVCQDTHTKTGIYLLVEFFKDYDNTNIEQIMNGVILSRSQVFDLIKFLDYKGLLYDKASRPTSPLTRILDLPRNLINLPRDLIKSLRYGECDDILKRTLKCYIRCEMNTLASEPEIYDELRR